MAKNELITQKLAESALHYTKGSNVYFLCSRECEVQHKVKSNEKL